MRPPANTSGGKKERRRRRRKARSKLGAMLGLSDELIWRCPKLQKPRRLPLNLDTEPGCKGGDRTAEGGPGLGSHLVVGAGPEKESFCSSFFCEFYRFVDLMHKLAFLSSLFSSFFFFWSIPPTSDFFATKARLSSFSPTVKRADFFEAFLKPCRVSLCNEIKKKSSNILFKIFRKQAHERLARHFL